MSKKNVLAPADKTAQDFVNVEDITGGLLYAADGWLFGFLALRAGDKQLLSEQERISDARAITDSLAGEREPWQLLSVPRTVNTQGMIERLTVLRQRTGEDAKLKLINGEIEALQEMTREGTKEPMIVLKCWRKAARGADKELLKRLRELRARLTDNRVSAELMSDPEITYLCKVFADLAVIQSTEDEVFEDDVPVLIGQKRTLQKDRSGNADLLNLITPIGGISFGVSSVTVGSVKGRVYGALRYPAELDYGWAVELVNGTDCVTGLTYYPGSVAELGNALSSSISQSRKDAFSQRDARQQKRLIRQAEDADRLIDELDAHNAAIGHLSLLVMPFTSREEEFEDVCQAVVGRYARKRIKLKSLGGVQKEAYRQISPYHISQTKIDDMIKHIMPLESLLGGSPMTVNIYRDDNGSYFARTMDGGIMSVDLLYRGGDRTNSNIVATGAMGRGKSTALKHLLETLYMTGVKCIVIDPEREFRDLCRRLGGTWLDAGGGNAKVNPLQIKPVPMDEEDEYNPLYRSNENAMALHIHTLEVLFRLNIPSLTDLQMALVKRALEETYAKYGISWSTDVAGLAPDGFPILSDLHDRMLEMAKSTPAYEEISTLFYDMARGADSFLWNGHTNVDMENDFIVLDTNRLSDSGDNLKKAQYFNLLTMGWEIMSRDRDEPVFMLSDETYLIMDPNIPEPAMYMRNMAKRGRKYEAMLGTVFQSVVDVMDPKIKAYGQALLDNSTYKLLFGTDGKNLKETAEIFMLTEAEQNVLLSGKRGRALCLIGGQHIHVDFDIPQYKLDLMGTGGGR